MKAYTQFQDIIEQALNRNVIEHVTESFAGSDYRKNVVKFSYNDYIQRKSELSISNDLIDLANKIGAHEIPNQKIGHHPDFTHLKHTNNTERHYIVSTFIDIKNSTLLFDKYDEETVMIISNAIQLSAIKTCKLFGGFIHRLHGDGLFVYFGGKNVPKKLAVEHSLTALSFFSFFVKNDLKRVFEERGIERIYTKIGIDFGDEDKVLWGMAGINESSEITTCSLHTSLASKMQESAKANEIIVGENIKEVSSIDNSFFTAVEDKTYIHPPSLYKQYKFDWLRYLKTLSQMAVSMDGNLTFKTNRLISTNPNLTPIVKDLAKTNKPYAIT